MDKPLITVHMLVKNEDRFIWYAINSVLPYVDKILITDTGSTDKTLDIIRSIKSEKIKLTAKKITDIEQITRLRNDQVKNTDTDWFWVVDGDEIYPDQLSKEILDIIYNKGEKLEGIVVGRYDLMGDIYHYQEESVGSYNLFGRRGHIAIRLINKAKVPDIHVKGIYPYEGYYDKKGIEIIHHSAKLFGETRGKLFHAMYLKRSTKGANLTDTYHRSKSKIESGLVIRDKSLIPEVFYIEKPEIVPEVTEKRNIWYEIAASFITPVKKIKRKVLS